ncbi:MFS general substrate transporter [Fomitiporia mediterranea MF3/22]|uniref:MFS general substrate transporter n=1 Tax=Fomitiporia mediterranea (strain MF3/22) TaxID=694068 RepID=UPI00044083E6|nr:MFS general substrate transporter [Fomitiporia mediterranea MF3/22]EJD08563.1 MFS general substrate transporter [Fomitiporia mediterranea MF3/22]
MVLTSEKVAFSDTEKGHPEQTSVDESNQDVSDVDLANYHEENAGSLVIDPEEAKAEFGEAAAKRLKLSRDGTKPSDDPEDPQNWSDRRKTIHLIVLTLAAIVPDFDSAVARTTGIPTLFALAQQFNTTTGEINNLTSKLIRSPGDCPSLFSLPYAGWGGIFAAMIMRKVGRLPVLFWSQVLALVFMVGCTFAPTLAGFAAFRCLTAFFGTCPQVTGLFVIADMYPFHLQARMLNTWTMGFIVSPFLSPFALGFLVARQGWRWAYGCATLYGVVVVLLIAFLMEETLYDRQLKSPPPRRSTGLRYRVETLIGITGARMAKYRQTWSSAIIAPASIAWRPHLFLILLFEAMVFGFGIGINVTNVVFLGDPAPLGYGFSEDAISGSYGTPIVAVFVGELIGRYANDWFMNMGIKRNNGVFEAETRLWACYIAMPLYLCGFLVLGASFQNKLSVGAMVMGWGIAQVAIMINTVAVYAYFNDCFPRYKGEISGLVNLARTLGGFSIPYFQIPWATKSGALQTFGVEAAIVIGLFILIVPYIQIKGKSLRREGYGSKRADSVVTPTAVNVGDIVVGAVVEDQERLSSPDDTFCLTIRLVDDTHDSPQAACALCHHLTGCEHSPSILPHHSALVHLIVLPSPTFSPPPHIAFFFFSSSIHSLPGNFVLASPAATQANSAHTPSASTSTDPSPSADDLLWEGDKMFNIYIWDYCVKRGYSNTARELAEEAKLNPNPRPPIDAKQGLLYEWWSVFWVLFSAKSNNSGSEDAMLYMQNHMAAQARMHQLTRYPNNVRVMPGAPGAMQAVPNSLGAGAPPPHPGHPSQPSNAHPMPNGVGPTPTGQQQGGQPQGQGPHPQQAPTTQQPSQAPLGFPSHVQQHQPQANGVPALGRAPMTAPGAGQPGRTGMPYFSPTMAHQQTGGPPPPYPGHASGVPPNMYPQHMRGMPPPGAPNGVPGAAGSPNFPQGAAGSGSRAPTPAQPAGSGITQPSPSMQHRSVPATPPNFGGMSVPPGRGPPFEQINMELSKIDPATLNELRQELNLGNKDPAAMTLDEKNRLLNAFKHRSTAGPSNPARAQQGRGSKRNSVSPGDEHAEIPSKGEASPPAQKRVRRSPEQPAPPTAGSAGSAPPQGGPSNANPNPMMYQGGMVPNMRPAGAQFTPQMGPMIPPGMVMGPPGAPHPGMANQQFKTNPAAYANMMKMAGMTMQQPMPGSGSGENISNMPSDPQQQQMQPLGSDLSQARAGPQPFPAGQRPSMNQGKMLPPSSPATTTNINGQGKPPQNVQAKPENAGKVENSPRNAPPPSASGPSGPNSSTPAPGPGQVGTSAPSPSLTNQSRPTTAASNPPSGGASAPGSAPPLSAPNPPASAPPTSVPDFDFMTTGFDDFTSMFGRDDNLTDFDRDFGSWFSGDMSGLGTS